MFSPERKVIKGVIAAVTLTVVANLPALAATEGQKHNDEIQGAPPPPTPAAKATVSPQEPDGAYYYVLPPTEATKPSSRPSRNRRYPPSMGAGLQPASPISAPTRPEIGDAPSGKPNPRFPAKTGVSYGRNGGSARQ